MSVTWSHFRSNNMTPPLTLENIFRQYGSWAGIHDFDFDSLSEIASAAVTGTVSANWTGNTVATGLPPNFSVRYHKTDFRQAIMLAATGTSIFYTVGTDENGYPFIIWANNTITYSVPVATPEEADVEIVFRQQVLDDREDIVWRTISIYMNDAWVTTYSDYDTASVADDVAFAVAAYEGDARTYTNIRIPELCEIAEFGTLDPGENALSGLQRTIDGRYLKMLARYDGSLRAWRKKTRDSVMTFTISVTGISRSYDLPQLITHARMLGAYIEAEFHDAALTEKYMHRFAEVNNAMLLTRGECLTEAENTVLRSEEAAFTLTFEAQWVPILEPEDRIAVDGDTWIINDMSITGGPGRISAVYNCRKYVWES